MLAEITGITLVILFLLWTCREGTLAGEMSIGTLLESVVIENAVIWIGLTVLKPRARNKVRNKHVRLTFGWSSAVLRSVS